MRTTPCRGCGQGIGFIKTVAGKTIPVDSRPVRFTRGGTEVFVMPSGEVIYGTSLMDSQADPDELIGYTSHFATCPAAGSFRRRRKSDKT